eukprot:scaffold130984_cov33-Tisochrysis_lutea.AAC.5
MGGKEFLALSRAQSSHLQPSCRQLQLAVYTGCCAGRWSQGRCDNRQAHRERRFRRVVGVVGRGDLARAGGGA